MRRKYESLRMECMTAARLLFMQMACMLDTSFSLVSVARLLFLLCFLSFVRKSRLFSSRVTLTRGKIVMLDWR